MNDLFKYTITSSSWAIGDPVTILTIEDDRGAAIEIPLFAKESYATAVAKCADIIKAIEEANS